MELTENEFLLLITTAKQDLAQHLTRLSVEIRKGGYNRVNFEMAMCEIDGIAHRINFLVEKLEEKRKADELNEWSDFDSFNEGSEQ